MPIEMDEFEQGKAVEKTSRSNRKNDVIAFLLENTERAFTQREVAEQCDMTSTHARSVLVALEEEEKVERKLCEDEKGSPRIHYKWVGK